MKKLLLAAVLFACCVGFALPQQRPTLGVLSFYGSSVEEGDAIATLFGMQPVLTQNFVVLPRTADALEAIFAEHDFQLEGLTDSDTIAGIGRALGAQYVLSGSVRRLGAVNLLVATIINVESFEQVAGYFRTFHTLAEIQGFLDPISRSLVNDMNRRRGVVIPNSLAIVPFAHRPGVDPHDAYTLTQILTLELLNTGYYAILPRTTAINMAIAEFDFQMDGHVADEEMAALGRAINAEYVLSGTISSIGGENMFIASILRVADGSLVVGASRNYRLIGDGVTLMREVARLLTDEEARTEEARRLYQEARRIADARAAEEIALAEARAAEERRQAEIRARQEEAERARQERIARREERREARRERMGPVAHFFEDEDRRLLSIRNEVEWLSLFFCWEAGPGDASRGVGSSLVPILIPGGIYFSPVPYLSLGFETRMTSLENIDTFFNAAFSVGTVIAANDFIRIFANGLFEMGGFNRAGLIVDGVTPGFDMGIAFDMPMDALRGVSFNVRYRCLIFSGASSHALHFGVALRFSAVARYFEMLRDLFD